MLSLVDLHLCCSDVAPQYPGRGRHPQVRKEIVRSEESYVKGLRTLVGVFLRPMEKWAAQGGDEADITSGAEHKRRDEGSSAAVTLVQLQWYSCMILFSFFLSPHRLTNYEVMRNSSTCFSSLLQPKAACPPLDTTCPPGRASL